MNTVVDQALPSKDEGQGAETNSPSAIGHVSSVPTIIIIQPSRGWSALNLHELWEYRDLIYFLLWRQVKGRYRPYPLFNYSALLPWGFFSGAVSGAANSLLSYKGLISKVYFPRLVVPVVGVLSGLVDFAISFVILLGMMLFYGYSPTWTIVTIPLYLLLAAATALAVGLWAASWIVYYRDVRNILGYIMSGWMYATPIVYAISMVPEEWHLVYRLNPMTNVIEGFRWALLGVGQISNLMLLLSTLLVLPVLISGAYYFRRTERAIVDIA